MSPGKNDRPILHARLPPTFFICARILISKHQGKLLGLGIDEIEAFDHLRNLFPRRTLIGNDYFLFFEQQNNPKTHNP
ncbi:MAG: hypothetical protein JWM68_4016 [Verrucomicrobiales bacterium]|nr:hypothetical protein [Verrucomicrobiales bacterium]